MGKQWKQWDLFTWAPKSLQMVTAAMKLKDTCSLEEMINLDSRDITLPTKVCLVNAIVFPVVMYGCESWTINKAERWRIDAFKLWCWRLLRVPWTARRSNQSILKEISPDYSLEVLMLKLQYFGHLMQRTDSLERPSSWERLKVGGEGDNRGQDGWMAPLTRWTWVWVGSGSWWWTEKTGMLQSMGSQSQKMTEWLNRLNWYMLSFITGFFHFYYSSYCLFKRILIFQLLGMSFSWLLRWWMNA